MGLRIKELRLGTKEVSLHLSSKFPCAAGTSRLPLVEAPCVHITGLQSQPAREMFYSRYSFPQLPFVWSQESFLKICLHQLEKSLNSFIWSSNLCSNPEELTGPSGNHAPGCRMELGGEVFAYSSTFGGWCPERWHLSLGVNAKLHHKWTI